MFGELPNRTMTEQKQMFCTTTCPYIEYWTVGYVHKTRFYGQIIVTMCAFSLICNITADDIIHRRACLVLRTGTRPNARHQHLGGFTCSCHRAIPDMGTPFIWSVRKNGCFVVQWCDFICMGFAELWVMGRKRKIQNENICLQPDLSQQQFTPVEC